MATVSSTPNIVMLRQGSGKDGQGMALGRKALKLKPLPRAWLVGHQVTLRFLANMINCEAQQGSGKDGQGMALKAKGLKAQTLA